MPNKGKSQALLSVIHLLSLSFWLEGNSPAHISSFLTHQLFISLLTLQPQLVVSMHSFQWVPSCFPSLVGREVRFIHTHKGAEVTTMLAFQRTLALSENLNLTLDTPQAPSPAMWGTRQPWRQIAHVRAMLSHAGGRKHPRANLGIFKIEQPASKDLQNLEKVVCLAKALMATQGRVVGREEGVPWASKTPGTRKMGARGAFFKNKGKSREQKSHFTMNSSVAFSTFTMLYNHHL